MTRGFIDPVRTVLCAGRCRFLAAAVGLCVFVAHQPVHADLCVLLPPGSIAFGNCHRKLVAHSGEFPFGLTVIESQQRVAIVDLFTGLLYKYDKTAIDASDGPEVVSGPLPSPVTYTGIAYHDANQELFWVADAGMGQMLVRTSVADPTLMTSMVPLSAPSGGLIGDISHNPDTNTFWGCDLTNDEYFQFNPNGTLVTGTSFISPTVVFGAPAFGTGITVALFAGQRVLDIPVGFPIDLKPTEVRRIALTGTEVGLSYRLRNATTSSFQWITGIGYSSGGSVAGPTEFVVDGIGNFLFEVPVLEQTLTHIIGLDCSVDEDNNVTVSWINTDTYAAMRILRDRVLLDTLVPTTDMYFDDTVDEGTHTYSIEVTETAGGTFVRSGLCSVVVGPGRLVAAVPHVGNNPLGATIVEDELYVVDLNGSTHIYQRDLTQPTTSLASLFPASNLITGIAYDGTNLFLYNATTERLARTNVPPTSVLGTVPLTSPAGGAIADITYDPSTGTFWGVDITQDIYFEFNADGTLGAGMFTFPLGLGRGNGITAVGNSGLFDIPTGQTGSPVVTRVVRVDDTGALQSEFDVSPTTRAGFVNGIAWADSGSTATDPSEYVVGNDTNTIYELSLLTQGAPFVRGDADVNGTVNLLDATFTLQYLFGPGTLEPTCLDALDSNDQGPGPVAIDDVTYTLAYLFMGGPTPPLPFPTCEIDPTDDSIRCEEYDVCP